MRAVLFYFGVMDIMKKSVMVVSSLFLMALVFVFAYQYYKGSVRVKTAESPDEVVRKFYEYIGEGGSSSLSEAYKLISTKHYTLTEDKFKGIVLNYPKMKVKIIGNKVLNGRAVVTIEYKVASAFGGDFDVKTDINLDLDERLKSWKIDFTGETYEGQKT